MVAIRAYLWQDNLVNIDGNKSYTNHSSPKYLFPGHSGVQLSNRLARLAESRSLKNRKPEGWKITKKCPHGRKIKNCKAEKQNIWTKIWLTDFFWPSSLFILGLTDICHGKVLNGYNKTVTPCFDYWSIRHCS